jgi:DNA-binding transcriptional MerR regulator
MHQPQDPDPGTSGYRRGEDQRQVEGHGRVAEDHPVDDSAMEDGAVGYRGVTACSAVGISYRQLDYWARTTLVVPSVRDASGSGTQRLYSFRDLVVLKVVKRLLDAGVSLQNIRRAIETLRSRGVADLAGITLISDGTTVYECRSPEEVVDLLQGGQGVFGIAIGGAFKEIQGSLSHLPAEPAGEPTPVGTSAEPGAADAGDELAARRARRRAG